MSKNPGVVTGVGNISKGKEVKMPQHDARKVSPSSMKHKKAGPVAPKKKITSTEQIVDYRKKKYGI